MSTLQELVSHCLTKVSYLLSNVHEALHRRSTLDRDKACFVLVNTARPLMVAHHDLSQARRDSLCPILAHELWPLCHASRLDSIVKQFPFWDRYGDIGKKAEELSKAKKLTQKFTELLISWRTPLRAISRDSLGQWTGLVSQKAGIDMSIFSFLSARAAATSKAAKFVPLRQFYRLLAGDKKAHLPLITTNPSWSLGLWSGSSSLIAKQLVSLSSLMWSHNTLCYEIKIKVMMSLPLMSEVHGFIE